MNLNVSPSPLPLLGRALCLPHWYPRPPAYKRNYLFFLSYPDRHIEQLDDDEMDKMDYPFQG